MASSSSDHKSKKMKSSSRPGIFEVFINHSGPDVKETLALRLYNSLKELGFQAFLDSQETEPRYLFPASVQAAIRSASVQIAIFSKGYAESAWCLEELALMLDTKAKMIPVFYDVAPSDLHDIEEGAYGDAFAKYKEKGMYLDKLDEWKQALQSVSIMMTSYDFNKHKHNRYALCKIIVEAVRQEIESKKSLESSKVPLQFDEIEEKQKEREKKQPIYAAKCQEAVEVAKYPVGLEEVVEDFKIYCMQHETNIIGIFGTSGSGKTTLAKQLFNLRRSEFDGSCFLFDVRETELGCLQSKLVNDLFRGDFKDIPLKDQVTGEVTSDLTTLLTRASKLRFLIVLDDVDHGNQINALFQKDVMNSTSLVIVTARDEMVLREGGIGCSYRMKPMNLKIAKELFCCHAFHKPSPESGYEDLVRRFVITCDGLPLMLGLLGGHVFGLDERGWELALNNIRQEKRSLNHILKVIFDALDKEAKQIFIDITCFFIGHPIDMAIRIWEASGWNAEKTLQILKDKSLVELDREEMGNEYSESVESDERLTLQMHSSLRDFGREMSNDFSSPRRLWRTKDLEWQKLGGFQKILLETSGESLRSFYSIFDWSFGITYFLGNSHGYDGTVLLWLELDLRNNLLKSLPPWITLQHLQGLKISNGGLERLWHSDMQAPFLLKKLVLYRISSIESLKSIEMLNHLEHLVFSGDLLQTATTVMDGKSLSQSLRKLTQLRILVLRHFTLSGELYFTSRRKSFLSEPTMNRLEKIEITNVELTSKVSISGGFCSCLQSLKISGMEDLCELELTGLNTLHNLSLEYCTELKSVSGICDLKSLKMLYLLDCSKLETMPNLANSRCLERVTIDDCPKLQNLYGIEELQELKYMHVSKVHGPVLGIRPMWNNIHSLQRLPSITTVIGRAVNETESVLSKDILFSNQTSIAEVNQIPYESQNMRPQSMHGIIICALLECRHESKVIEIPFPASYSITSSLPLPNWKRHGCRLPLGEWIITIAVVGDFAPHYISQSFWIGNKGHRNPTIKKGYIVALNKDEEGGVLFLFKNIMDKLYYHESQH